jgi:signal transduction histidine kinase
MPIAGSPDRAQGAEAVRLAALERLEVLDTEPEATFDRVVAIVAATLDVPIAMITLVDRDRCWYKAEVGLGRSEMARSDNMCDTVIRQDGVYVVNDAHAAAPDHVLPMLTLGVRFYIGVPLRTSDGVRIGTLCAVGTDPREVTEREKHIMTALAEIVSGELELRLTARRMAQTEDAMRRLNQQLAVANQNKSDFLASMSHELRTPLNGVLGASELLGQGIFGALNEKQMEYVQDIHRSGVHLLALINDILDLSRIEAGQIELHRETLEVAAFMEGCAAAMRGLAATKSLELRVVAPSEPTVLSADERRLTQVACNLLSNAVKFAPGHGTVGFRASREGDSIMFVVEDEGPGIPPEFRERIFERFFRVPSEQEGTGLGLPLARRLVELHGGRIWLENEARSGSRFCFSVPVAGSA